MWRVRELVLTPIESKALRGEGQPFRQAVRQNLNLNENRCHGTA
jgi:hypothetical protein